MDLNGEGFLDEEFGLLFDDMMELAKLKIRHLSLEDLLLLQSQIDTVDGCSFYGSYRIAPYIKPYVTGEIRNKQNMKNN